MKLQHLTLAVALAAIAVTGCSQKSDLPADVKDRQNLMQDWRGANEAMKGMMEKPETFDAATFKERAEFIQGSQEQMWQHFTGDDKKGGKAKETVWSDAVGWKNQVDTFNQAANALATASAGAQSAADVEKAYGDLASSCGSCHKAFKAD